MPVNANNIRNSETAFHAVITAVDALAHAMAEAQAPNGEAAYSMYITQARQALLESVAALDGRLRRVTLPALPTLPTQLEAR